MKRNKLYVILSFLACILLFSISALCNQCGAADNKDKIDVEEDLTDEELADANIGDEEEGIEEGEDEEEGEEEPTVELKVYEGPLFSEANDVCYYRIEAKVKGNPEPTIEFSKDDSNGAWGPTKTQVNLNYPDDIYTLVVTATNSVGTVSESIVIEWGCDEPDPEPEPGIPVEEIGIGAEGSLSGYIAQGFGPTTGTDEVFFGDNNTDTVTKGYLSFDISGLSGLGDVTITDVDLVIPINEIGNEPWLAADEIHIKVLDYGNELDVPDDFAIGGTMVKIFNTSDSLADLNFGTNALKSELQAKVDIGEENFQLKLSLTNKSNNGVGDWYLLKPSGASLQIKYEVPQ